MKSVNELQADFDKAYAEYNDFKEKNKAYESTKGELHRKVSDAQDAIWRAKKEATERIRKEKAYKGIPSVRMSWKNGARFDGRVQKYWELYNLLFSFGLPDELNTNY